MACLVKRSKDGGIASVNLSDGKSSKAYSAILKELKSSDGVPSDFSVVVNQSISPYVGKYINNTTDLSEIALGLYVNIYTSDFKSWYGDWSQTGEEPKVYTVDGMKVFRNSKGEVRSIYNTGSVKTTKQTYYRSVAAKKMKPLTDYVRKSVKVLNLRITEARQLRDKVNNNPKLSKEEKIKQSKYYNDIIKDSIEKKTLLKEKNELEYIFLLAETDLDMAQDVVVNSTKSTMGEVRVAHRAVETWNNIVNLLGLKDLSEISEENRERIGKIESKASDLDRRMVDLSVKLIALNFSKENKEIDPEKLYNSLKALPDVGRLTSEVRDISTTGVPIVNLLSKVLQEANLKISKEHGRIYGAIDQAYERIKNNPEIAKNGFEIFIKEQTNKFNETTFGLVGRYSQAYYDIIRSRRRILNSQLDEAGSNTEKRKKAYDLYNEWINKNTFLFNAVPFLDSENYTDEDRNQSVAELLNLGFTRMEAADVVKESERLYKRFLEQKERYKIDIEDDIDRGKILLPDGITKDEYVKNYVDKWDSETNPIRYIQQLREPSLVANYAYKGMYYTIKVPRKSVDGKATEYYDPNFARIASDPQLFEFYNFFRNNITDSLSYLPEEEVDDLQSNFLPVITERIAKEYGLTNLKETVNGVGDFFLKTFTSIEYIEKKTIDPATGKEIFSLKPKYISEKVPVSERSKDLVTMMKLFSDMSLVYKHKLQVQDYVDAINNIIQKTEKTLEINDFGETIIDPKAPRNLQGMVESEVKRSFYGVRTEREILLKSRKFYNGFELLSLGLYKSENYAKGRELEKEILAITKKLENEEDTLTEKQLEELEKQLDQKKTEYYKLGGRMLSLNKSLDSSINYTRLLGLALQPFSALRNLLVGGINNVIHAYGGVDFKYSDIKKATFFVKDSILKYWSKGTAITDDAEKLMKFMADIGTIETVDGVLQNSVISKTSTKEHIMRMIPNAFTLMKGTDFIFKSQTALATAFNKKIKTEKGEFDIYEVLDKNLEFNEEKFGKYDASLNGNEDFETVYNDFILKVGQITKKLHGLSTNRTGLKGKDTVWGRLLFLFKTWLPETVATRFEGRKYDEFLERDVEGYYRTFARKIFKEEGLSGFRTLIRAAFSEEVDDLSEIERENLRKMFAEMVAVGGVTLLYFALKSMAPDDDDDDAKVWNLIVNQTFLLQRDLTFYSDPTAFGDLTAQVVPSVQGLITLKRAVGTALWDIPLAAAGVEGYDYDENVQNFERDVLRISKSLPILNNANRFVYYEKKLTDVR
jgi:hypothetical protein